MKWGGGAKCEEHVASVESLKAQINLGTEGSAADKALKNLLEQEEVALEKAKKIAPSTEVLTCALKTAAKTWRITVRERGERATNGAAKAEERRKERLEKIAELEKEVKPIKSAVCYHDVTYEEAHRDRTLLQGQVDTRVTDLRRVFDKFLFGSDTSSPAYITSFHISCS